MCGFYTRAYSKEVIIVSHRIIRFYDPNNKDAPSCQNINPDKLDKHEKAIVFVYTDISCEKEKIDDEFDKKQPTKTKVYKQINL